MLLENLNFIQERKKNIKIIENFKEKNKQWWSYLLRICLSPVWLKDRYPKAMAAQPRTCSILCSNNWHRWSTVSIDRKADGIPVSKYKWRYSFRIIGHFYYSFFIFFFNFSLFFFISDIYIFWYEKMHFTDIRK